VTTKWYVVCDQCGYELSSEGEPPENWERVPHDPNHLEYSDLCPKCFKEYENQLGEFFK